MTSIDIRRRLAISKSKYRIWRFADKTIIRQTHIFDNAPITESILMALGIILALMFVLFGGKAAC
jgi:hypothetical protein